MLPEENDLEKVGLFRDGPYDTDVTLERPDIKDVYGRDKPDPNKWLNGPYPHMQYPKWKAGTNDWPFSEFTSINVDEPYQDPGSYRKKDPDDDAKNISEAPFLSAYGPKDPNGSGTYYGTFITEMEAMSPEIREDTTPREEKMRNILGSPPKKGTGYGYADICINPYPEHEDDPFFDGIEFQRAAREAHEAAVIGTGPFLPSGYPKEYFDPNPYYDDQDPDGTQETYDWEKLASKEVESDKPPFLPVNFPKKINGNKDVISPLERFPSYDPSSPYQDPPKYIFRKLKPVDEDKPPWRDTYKYKAHQNRSIVCYNVGFRVNATNFRCL